MNNRQQVSAEASLPDRNRGGQDDPPARGAKRPAGRGGAAALRLDKRTYLDLEQGRYSVTLRTTGAGCAKSGGRSSPLDRLSNLQARRQKIRPH